MTHSRIIFRVRELGNGDSKQQAGRTSPVLVLTQNEKELARTCCVESARAEEKLEGTNRERVLQHVEVMFSDVWTPVCLQV